MIQKQNTVMESFNNNAGISASSLPNERLPPGVKADFECLINKFHELGSLEFQAFSSAWRSMKMSMISVGRLNERELRQFIDECLLIIVSYLQPQHNFQTKTAAFYLLYSFYITQPLIPKSQIRITLKNWVTLNSFIQEAISEELHDVEFIFHKLCANKVFYYVAPPNEIFQSQVISDPLDEEEDDDDFMKQFFSEKSSELETIFSNDNIEQLSAVHNQYQEMKCIISGIEMPSPDSSVNMLEVNTATVIADFMQQFETESKAPDQKLTKQKKRRRKTKNQKKKSRGSSSPNFFENEVVMDEMPETSTAGISNQTELSSEGDINCEVYYQVAEECDLIINDNRKNNVDLNEENMETPVNIIMKINHE